MKRLASVILSAGMALGLSLSAFAATAQTLPDTGGIGTKIFTVAGIVVMIVAVILLIVRRKMSSDE